jgi:hypothetical protein
VLGILAAVLCGGCGPEAGGGDAPAAGRLVAEAALGPLAASVRMAPAEPRFGDRVTFVLEARAEAGAVLEAPVLGARLGHFRIRDTRDESRLDEGRLALTIVAEPERTGTNIARWPALRFSVAAGEGAGTERELVIPPAEVEVAGLTPDQRPELADLGGPLPGVALPAEGGSGILYWLGGLGVLGLGGLLYWRSVRAGRGAGDRVPEIDAGTEAARAFAALRASGLAEQGRFAEFYVRLTGIVRRYIERTTGLHAPEQTTEEFLREMERHPDFDGDRRRELGEFLAASDLVKYAAQVPTGVEIRGAVTAARAFCGLGGTGEEAAA